MNVRYYILHMRMRISQKDVTMLLVRLVLTCGTRLCSSSRVVVKLGEGGHLDIIRHPEKGGAGGCLTPLRKEEIRAKSSTSSIIRPSSN